MTAAPRARGFTLLELMVAIGVLAILLLITLPSYMDRIVREQVLEALPLADLLKPPVEAAWRNKQPLPADNAAAGRPAAEKIVNQVVSSVALQDGAIHVTFGNRANGALKGKVLSIRPAVVEDEPIVPVTWLCGNAPAPEKMVAKGANRTDIPNGLLPLRCRAG
ncbi:pilin [Ramlibacter albus]